MKNKKSFIAIETFIYFGIGAFIFIILAIIVPRLLSESGTQTSDFLSQTKDYDNDGIANFFDKCICIWADTDNGCPDNEDDEESKYKECPDDKTPKSART